MMYARKTAILTAAALAASLMLPVGAVDAKTRAGKPHFRTAKTWTMPWQLSRSSATSRAKGERTIVARVNVYGKTRGTKLALRYIFASLPESPGRNNLVNACRTTVAKSARKLGAIRVDAASAGPERRTRGGYLAPVGFRLIYATLNGRENYEVRQSVLTCKADTAGKILDAYA